MSPCHGKGDNDSDFDTSMRNTSMARFNFVPIFITSSYQAKEKYLGTWVLGRTIMYRRRSIPTGMFQVPEKVRFERDRAVLGRGK